MDKTYIFNGSSAPAFENPFIVKDTWVDWLQKMWISALINSGYVAQQAPWIPTYESGTVSWPGNDGSVQTLSIDRFFLVTKETAERLASIFATLNGPLRILEIPFFNSVNRHLQWPNGKIMDANQLAEFYTNMPEDKNPGLAKKMCELLIAREIG